MSTYTIGETARRSGFSASALRFYEDIGLVDPTGAHRRRLPPLRRRCAGPAGVHRPGQAARLLAGGDHRPGRHLGRAALRAGAAPLPRPGHRQDPRRRDPGRRADARSPRSCGRRPSSSPANRSTGRAARTAPASPATPRRRASNGDGHVGSQARHGAGRGPDRLHPGARRDARPARRVGQRAGRRDAPRRRSSGGLRIEFGPDVDLGELGRLVGAEQHCCAFFQFTLTVDADGIGARGPGPGAGRRASSPTCSGSAA